MVTLATAGIRSSKATLTLPPREALTDCSASQLDGWVAPAGTRTMKGFAYASAFVLDATSPQATTNLPATDTH